MTSPRAFASRSPSFIAGGLPGLFAAPPALADALGGRAIAGPELLLYASIGLLVTGIALGLAKHHHQVEPSQSAPDLRWWKNPQR